jgi:acyl carrier protein
MSTAEQIMAFTITSLEEMNFQVRSADSETMLGPSGVDLDSLAVAELLARFEDNFGVTFLEDEVEQMAIMTIGEVAEMVAQRAAQVQLEGAPG